MSFCRACRSIKKVDYDNSEIHLGTCQECGRSNRAIRQEFYENISQKEVQR